MYCSGVKKSVHWSSNEYGMSSSNHPSGEDSSSSYSVGGMAKYLSKGIKGKVRSFSSIRLYFCRWRVLKEVFHSLDLPRVMNFKCRVRAVAIANSHYVFMHVLCHVKILLCYNTNLELHHYYKSSKPI